MEQRSTQHQLDKQKKNDWFLRFLKGMFIGSGFILPGVSGGALAAIFGNNIGKVKTDGVLLCDYLGVTFPKGNHTCAEPARTFAIQSAKSPWVSARIEALSAPPV